MSISITCPKCYTAQSIPDYGGSGMTRCWKCLSSLSKDSVAADELKKMLGIKDN